MKKTQKANAAQDAAKKNEKSNAAKSSKKAAKVYELNGVIFDTFREYADARRKNNIAAAIADAINWKYKNGARNIASARAKILQLAAADAILNGQDAANSEKAVQYLRAAFARIGDSAQAAAVKQATAAQLAAGVRIDGALSLSAVLRQIPEADAQVAAIVASKKAAKKEKARAKRAAAKAAAKAAADAPQAAAKGNKGGKAKRAAKGAKAAKK